MPRRPVSRRALPSAPRAAQPPRVRRREYEAPYVREPTSPTGRRSRPHPPRNRLCSRFGIGRGHGVPFLLAVKVGPARRREGPSSVPGSGSCRNPIVAPSSVPGEPRIQVPQLDNWGQAMMTVWRGCSVADAKARYARSRLGRSDSAVRRRADAKAGGSESRGARSPDSACGCASSNRRVSRCSHRSAVLLSPRVGPEPGLRRVARPTASRGSPRPRS